MNQSLLFIGLLLNLSTGWGQSARPALSNGVVTYTAEDGQLREMRVGVPCADLWTSPDGNVIAFIGIEKARPAMGRTTEPFIEESSIFVARKEDGFKPVHFAVNVELDGRSWKIAREPKLSPNLSKLYFFVPNSMTSWTLVTRPLNVDTGSIVSRGSEYCVIWGGSDSGDLVILTRMGPGRADPEGGVTYPCYVRAASGSTTKLADECFAAFDKLADHWSREHGGICR